MRLVCTAIYDKIDKVYMRDSITLDRSLRSICRGYLNIFEQNRKMNYKEYELRKIGYFDDESGVFTPINPPETVDPTIVYDKPQPKEGEEVEL